MELVDEIFTTHTILWIKEAPINFLKKSNYKVLQVLQVFFNNPYWINGRQRKKSNMAAYIKSVNYRPIHKTLPKSSSAFISRTYERFYETDFIRKNVQASIFHVFLKNASVSSPWFPLFCDLTFDKNKSLVHLCGADSSSRSWGGWYWHCSCVRGSSRSPGYTLQYR